MITRNFKEIVKPGTYTEDTPKVYDSRNGIWCYEPTNDMTTYINYIELLNGIRNGVGGVGGWKSFGYLDLGMMPLAMAPSFLQQTIFDGMAKIANQFNLPVYMLPPVTLLQDKCKLPQSDIWVFKSDVAKLFGKNESEVCFMNFLRWCGYELNGKE